jgi:hypothetical protein
MAQTETIREFLVALGYKQDEAALKKFSDGIDKATNAVVGLASAVSASALAVAIGVTRFASNLEALYFASMRTGASATNLKAFARAAQDFGASSSEAMGAAESFAAFLRNNPGGVGLLESMGVQVRDPRTGRLRDTSDVLADLGKQFAKMPTYLANQYAGMFGISDNMMLAMRNGDFAADMENIRRSLADAGFNQTAKDAHQFMMGVRDLGDQLQAFGLKVEDALLKHFGVSLKTVTEYLRAHGAELSDKIAGGLERILVYADKAKDFLEWLFGILKKLDDATGGWSTKLLGILALLKLVGGTEIIGGVLGLAAAFVRLGAGITGVSAAAAVLGGIGLGAWFDKAFPNNWLAQAGSYIGNKFYDYTHQKENAMMQLQMHGWSREQAAGIVANLNHESALDPNAEGDNGQAYGIAQWHSDRQAAFAKWAGHDIRKSTVGEQLDFVNYELRHDGGDAGARKAGMLIGDTDNAYDTAQYFSRFYERPKNADAEAEARGQAAIQLSAKTTIHIDGAKDPKAVADEVSAAQARTVTEMTRNLQPAVQ